MQSDILEKILQHARKADLVDELGYSETKDIILTEIENKNSDIVEQALLALYYFNFINPPENDLEAESVTEILNRLCENPIEEKEEKVRGRKIWIILNNLFAKENFKEIERLLFKLNETETSAFVWERVLAACSSKDDVYKLYPEILMQVSALHKIIPEKWNDFITNQEKYIRYYMQVANNINRNIPSWIESLLNEGGDYDAVLSHARIMGSTGTPMPLTAEQLSDLFSRADKKARHRLLAFFITYIVSMDNRERDDLFNELINEEEIISKENTKTAEDISNKLLKALSAIYENNLPTDYEKALINTLGLSSGERTAFGKCIKFLNTIDLSVHQAGLANDLWGKYSPHLLKLITDKKVPKEDILKSASLLSNRNQYFRQLGATLLLHAHRCGYDIKPVLGTVKIEYQQNPDIKNAFTEGKDIEKKEFEYSFSFPSFNLFAAEGKSEKGEDGFMNLGNLTGMLEACQPPVTAYRLKLLLEAFKEDINIIIKPAKTLQKNPEVVGPMSLDEVIDIFKNLSKDEADTSAIISKKDAEIAQLQLKNLTLGRRDQLKAVFENTEVDAITNYTLIRELIRKDGFMWPPFAHMGPDNTFDYLALYLMRKGLGVDKDFYSGVYFNAANMLSYIQYVDIPAEDLTMTVAVHELYHAFCEDMMRTSHSHIGEKPDYCKLEEASANREAFDWASTNLSKDVNKTLRSTLLATLDISPHVLPGYGDYNLLDNEAAGWVPVMLDEESHVQPPEYRNRKHILNADNQRAYETNSLIWRGMLGEIKSNESVCWFIDFR